MRRILRSLRPFVVTVSAILLFLTGGGDSAGLTAFAATPSRGASESLAGKSAGWLGESSTAVEELTDDLRTAITSVHGYWIVHWSNFFTGSYTPPRINQATLGLYNGYSPYAPTCRGEKLGPDNASYCAPENFVAWDVTFLRRGYTQGDGFVYLVVAHEWAHAIQAQLDESIVAVAKELQADCLAGAALIGAARDGRLQFEAGDGAEVGRSLIELADDTPWTRTGDHGSPAQRIRAFYQGGKYGVNGCLR